MQILCGNDAAEPPTTLALSASITTLNGNSITVNGNVYVRGLTFNAGGSGWNASFTANSSTGATRQTYELCNIKVIADGGNSFISLGPQGGGSFSNETVLKSCGLMFSLFAQSILVTGTVLIQGGSALIGGASPTNFLGANGIAPVNLLVEGFDFTNWGNFNFCIGGSFLQQGKAVFRNCKLSSGWSGLLFSTPLTAPSLRLEMHNCDGADTNYRLWVEDYYGSIKSETIIVRTGGATDGVVPFSFRMASTANVSYPLQRLESPELPARFNSTIGTPITVTVEIIHDTASLAGQGAGTAFAFTNDEVWLEVQYLGTSGTPVSTFASSAKATVLSAATDQPASVLGWTTTGMTTPVKQKLSVTFTPQKAGYLQAKVVLAKANKTLMVDPLMTVT